MFFFKEPGTTEIYTYGHTLSLHDALPIVRSLIAPRRRKRSLPRLSPPEQQDTRGRGSERSSVRARKLLASGTARLGRRGPAVRAPAPRDRKSTRLNSSH